MPLETKLYSEFESATLALQQALSDENWLEVDALLARREALLSQLEVKPNPKLASRLFALNAKVEENLSRAMTAVRSEFQRATRGRKLGTAYREAPRHPAFENLG